MEFDSSSFPYVTLSFAFLPSLRETHAFLLARSLRLLKPQRLPRGYSSTALLFLVCPALCSFRPCLPLFSAPTCQNTTAGRPLRLSERLFP